MKRASTVLSRPDLCVLVVKFRLRGARGILPAGAGGCGGAVAALPVFDRRDIAGV
ncbi:hypothetical protein ACLMAL_21235 [Nocardia sp. CWNU-33]|uniref:hypothetical protein n=1 Tax=Nocardia sp. CWNU-33 TaxID=3392117 RepID=UPI00398F2DE9